MTLEQEILKKYGLTENDLKPNKVTDKERLEAIEEAITELAEILVGDDND